MQRKLIKEWKDIDMKLDKKIVQKCTLEKTKFAILPSIHIPPETSPQAHPGAKITVPSSWPLVGKCNSDTQTNWLCEKNSKRIVSSLMI